MACFVLKLRHKNKCNTLPTLPLASCNYWCFSDAASPLILLDMRSRWRRGGDRNGQCCLYGWVLLSGRFVSKTALIICILMLKMFWVFSFACFWGFKSRCVCFQIEDIRNSIDKIDENVAEVKKLYSVILSAPTSDQSKKPQHRVLFLLYWNFCTHKFGLFACFVF